METQNIALILYTFLLSGYVVLDGFDLGVGILYPFFRSSKNKDLSLRSIGMPWDGNEIWLFTGGGILFAGAPRICAMIFHAFLHCWMIIVFSLALKGLIVRKMMNEGTGSQSRFIEISICVVCSCIAFCIGFITGQLVMGLPVDVFGVVYLAPFLSLIPLLCGTISVFLFALHGICKLCYESCEDDSLDLCSIATVNVNVLLMLYILCGFVMYNHFDWTFFDIKTNLFSAIVIFASFKSLFVVWFYLSRKDFSKAFLCSYVSMLAPLLSISIMCLPHVYDLANEGSREDVLGVCHLQSQL